jgi:hypothetical protein
MPTVSPQPGQGKPKRPKTKPKKDPAEPYAPKPPSPYHPPLKIGIEREFERDKKEPAGRESRELA